MPDIEWHDIIFNPLKMPILKQKSTQKKPILAHSMPPRLKQNLLLISPLKISLAIVQ